jgi:hypothetical protein
MFRPPNLGEKRRRRIIPCGRYFVEGLDAFFFGGLAALGFRVSLFDFA